MCAVNLCPLVESERAVLGIDHAELSGMAISRWELSEAVQLAAIDHHAPPAPGESGFPRRVPLSVGVHRADALVNQLGMSVLPPLPAQEAPSLEIPGVHFDSGRVLDRFRGDIQNLSDLFR